MDRLCTAGFVPHTTDRSASETSKTAHPLGVGGLDPARFVVRDLSACIPYGRRHVRMAGINATPTTYLLLPTPFLPTNPLRILSGLRIHTDHVSNLDKDRHADY